MRSLSPLLGLLLLTGLLASPGYAESPSAEYVIWGALEKDKPAVSRVVITGIGPTSDHLQEWQMTCSLAGGGDFAVRAVSERVPMTSSDGPGRFARYLFRDKRGKVTSYVNVVTGEVLLPRFEFCESFLPCCRPEMTLQRGFASSGTYLGHIATLQRTGTAPSPEPWPVDFELKLNPDMLVGMLWAAKDDGRGQDKDREYKYVELTQADHRELIEAGCNYLPTPSDRTWVQDAPVFFRAEPVFPEDFYRSNYAGKEMLADEPAVRMGLPDVLPPGITRPEQAADLLETRVRAIYGRDGVRSSLHEAVRKQAAIGALELAVDDVPVWETLYETAFYQLRAGAGGIVHEGRYSYDTLGWQAFYLFGPTEIATREEVLRCQFAAMRGAARAFHRAWGTSIYGQCEPAFREPALRVAYDMGARYFWFWTRDHDHHLVHTEKLRLMRMLKDYAASHPRLPIQAITDAPRTAIVLPWGYCLSFQHLFNLPFLSMDKINGAGVPYREPVAAALWEGLLCAMRSEDFDFLIEHPGLEKLGYRRLVRVGEDGYVDECPRRLEGPGHVQMSVELQPAARLKPAASAPASSPPAAEPAIVAGDTAGPAKSMLRWSIQPPALASAPSDWTLSAELVSLSPLPPAQASAGVKYHPGEHGSCDMLFNIDGEPGRYRLTVAPLDAQGRRGASTTKTLFIQPPRFKSEN